MTLGCLSAKLLSHTVNNNNTQTLQMKKTLLIAAAALAAGIVSTQAAVYSQNIVGYVNQILPGGNAYSMITCPVGGATNIENAISAVQTGDNVFIWTGGGYNVLTYVGPNFDGSGHAWADGDGNGQVSPIINPGQGIFYQNGQGTAETNTYTGSLVLSNSISLPGGNAYSMIASTPPIADALDGTNLALPFQTGDNVFLWTGAGYNALTYVGPNFDGSGHTFADGDGNGQPAPTVQVGQGFFYQNGQGSAETWIQNYIVQ